MNVTWLLESLRNRASRFEERLSGFPRRLFSRVVRAAWNRVGILKAWLHRIHFSFVRNPFLAVAGFLFHMVQWMIYLLLLPFRLLRLWHVSFAALVGAAVGRSWNSAPFLARKEPARGVFGYVTGFTPESYTALANFCLASGMDRVLAIVLDPDLHRGLRDREFPVHLIREFPTIDKQREIRLFEESHQFLTRFCESLGFLKYRGIPLVDLVKAILYTEHKFFKRLGLALVVAQEHGVRNVLFLTSHEHAYHMGSLDLALHLGFKSAVAYRCLGGTLQPRSWELRLAGGRMVQQVFPQEFARNVADEAAFEGKIVAGLRRCQSAGLFSPRRWTEGFWQFLYPHHVLREITIPRIARDLRVHGRAPVLVLTQALPDSIYWRALGPVLKRLAGLGHPAIVLTERLETLQACRATGTRSLLLDPSPIDVRPLFHSEILRPFVHRLLHRVVGGMDGGPGAGGEVECLDAEDWIFLRALASSAGFYQDLVRGIQAVDFYERILEAVAPVSVLVMPHSSTITYQLTAVARRCGVPTVSMPSVTVAPHRRSIGFWDVDLVAAYGEQCVEAFVGVGYPREMLVETGNASMDALHAIDPAKSREAVARQHGVDPARKIVLVATSRIDPAEHVWLRPLVEQCRRRGDAQVIVKVHPSYRREDYAEVGEPEDSPYCRILEKADLYDLLGAADAVVTDYSTVGAEAAILGKPLAVVNLLGKPYPSNNYDEEGIALAVTRAEEVGPVLTRLLDDTQTRERLAGARERFVRRYNHLNDGRAADRICEILIRPRSYLGPRFSPVETTAGVAFGERA